MESPELLRVILSHLPATNLARVAARSCSAFQQAAELAARDACSRRGIEKLSLWCTLKKATWVLQLHRAELGARAWRAPYLDGSAIIGGAQEACGVRFSDPAGSSFGRGGELFVANYGSKEIVHLWLDESGEGGGLDGLGGGGVARPRSQLRVDYLPVPGHCAAVCLSPDGERLAASIQEHHAEQHPTLTGEHFLVLASTGSTDSAEPRGAPAHSNVPAAQLASGHNLDRTSCFEAPDPELAPGARVGRSRFVS